MTAGEIASSMTRLTRDDENESNPAGVDRLGGGGARSGSRPHALVSSLSILTRGPQRTCMRSVRACGFCRVSVYCCPRSLRR